MSNETIIMKDLKITMIQSDLHWENKELNLNMFSEKLNNIFEDTDLIILPEMFTTGFSMQPAKYGESMDGLTIRWMKEKAKEKGCAITGSIIYEESGKYFNRLIWVTAEGNISSYDKRHLFRMGNENDCYTAGNKRILLDLKGWKICPIICYDLRFPVWSRNKLIKNNPAEATYSYEYDLLIYIANWPEIRRYPWKSLLTARAIENQCFVVGLNRIGKDGNGIYHSGDSAIIEPKGEIISNTKPHEESTETITLNSADLISYRKSFPSILDADTFEITN